MKLEGIMPSEVSWQGKTNTVWSHLYVESKKFKLIETESRLVVVRGGGIGEKGEGGQRVQTSRYKNEF